MPKAVMSQVVKTLHLHIDARTKNALGNSTVKILACLEIYVEAAKNKDVTTCFWSTS